MKRKSTIQTNAARLGNKLGTKLGALLLFTAAACITVNVNLPESAVQQAANDFVKDIYKDKNRNLADANGSATSETAKVKSTVKQGKKKSVKPVDPASSKPSGSILDLFIAPAYAIEAQMTVNTPKAIELRSKMSSRVVALDNWKKQGVICESIDGSVQKADIGKAGANAGEVMALVTAENKDRDALYEELFNANRPSNVKEAMIRKNFGGAFRAKANELGPQAVCKD